MDAGNGSFLDHVVSSANLRRAFRRVVGNRGAPGVDGMTVDQLVAAWSRLKPAICHQVAEGTYWPAAIRRHRVPKAGGGVRVLGIPTVVDRVVQQAIAQPLSALLDAGFSPCSFGFRPGRGAHDALQQAGRFVENGQGWVLHLDLEKFFDCVPHNLVVGRLRAQVADCRLLALIQKYLTVPFACGRRREARSMGLPQGSPLSPLLANLLLDGLDRRLFDAGFSFCRYADDICLYFQSRSDARKAFVMIRPWIETDLKLRINQDKTRILPVEQDAFLGYRLRLIGGSVVYTPSRAACECLRMAVRQLLVRHLARAPREHFCTGLMPLLRGWTNYFNLSKDRRTFVQADHGVARELHRWYCRCVRGSWGLARGLAQRHGLATEPSKVNVRKFTVGISAGSEANNSAVHVDWLQGQGWEACADFFRLQMFGRSESPISGVVASPRTNLDQDSRIAARACGLYEWKVMTGIRTPARRAGRWLSPADIRGYPLAVENEVGLAICPSATVNRHKHPVIEPITPTPSR